MDELKITRYTAKDLKKISEGIVDPSVIINALVADCVRLAKVGEVERNFSNPYSYKGMDIFIEDHPKVVLELERLEYKVTMREDEDRRIMDFTINWNLGEKLPEK